MKTQDDKSAKMATYFYDAYGELVGLAEVNGEPMEAVAFEYVPGPSYHWPSYDLDEGVGENNARHYDPTSGGWLSQDPMGFNAGESNLYRYPVVEADFTE